MLELTLKIILAHLTGDFVLQGNRMVRDIENRKFRSPFLYGHALIHFLLVLAVTKFEKQYLLPALLLAVSHLAIDMVTKIGIRNKISGMANLLLDQALHAIAIAVFIKHFHDYAIDADAVFNSRNYLLLAALVCTTFASAILMKKIMEIFNYPYPNNGIKDAGKYIGMLERLFIFAFITMSFWEGVGFLLAAKSIFRFGDLKENKEIKLTEYILIGTLISFGLAMLIAEVYLKLKAIV